MTVGGWSHARKGQDSKATQGSRACWLMHLERVSYLLLELVFWIWEMLLLTALKAREELGGLNLPDISAVNNSTQANSQGPGLEKFLGALARISPEQKHFPYTSQQLPWPLSLLGQIRGKLVPALENKEKKSFMRVSKETLQPRREQWPGSGWPLLTPSFTSYPVLEPIW